jgi:RHS repeat-associated protein
VTRYVYDGDDIALQFDGSNNLTHRYLHGPAVDQILADENVGGTLYWPLTDNLGTVRDLVNSSGTVQNHLKYDSFGKVTSESNSAVDHIYAFTGREWDEETGLQYHRARYLDVAVGTWIGEDPISFEAGDQNISRYVANIPTCATDPRGLERKDGNGDIYTYPTNTTGITWEVTPEKRIITMVVDIHLKPNPDYPPTIAEIKDFEDKAKKLIEDTFNGNNVSIVPRLGNGQIGDPWTPRVRVNFSDAPTGIDIFIANKNGADTSSTDWKGTVRPTAGITGFWDVLDVTNQMKPGAPPQYSVVHEFGHVIGLRHPGDPGPHEYTADPWALMGLGMQLRSFYFLSWALKLREMNPEISFIPWGDYLNCPSK